MPLESSTISSVDYGVQQAARIFSDAIDIHGSLPASTSYWVDRYVSATMSELWQAGDVEEFYAKSIAELCAEVPHKTLRIVSIGCGDAGVEIETCRRLIERGWENFTFECADVASGAIERGRRRAAELGLTAYFSLTVATYESLISVPSDVVVANQVLHHIIKLEELFSSIAKSIGQTGIFLSADMIGRNGHMLWPEALAVMDRFWMRLPDKYKQNHCLSRFEPQYSNWDNSKEANEGIRAQDILSLLVRNFGFERFYAAGNLAVALFGRHFGYNFDPKIEEDRCYIDQLSEIDHHLIDIGYLKPVLMYACMSNKGRGTSCYRHWTPDFCVRKEDPVAKFYAPNRYGLNKIIEFSERLPAIDCLGTGWSSPEVGGVWSNAPASEVIIPVESDVVASTDHLQLRIFGMQYQPDGVDNIPIEITVNGSIFLDNRFPGHQLGPEYLDFPLIGKIVENRIVVVFKYPKTWSALELGLANDARRLALRLIWFQILVA